MNILEKIRESAKKDLKKIVLPEGNEERTLIAAGEVKKQGIAILTLIGNEAAIKEKAKSLGVDISGIDIADPETHSKTATYANEFYELRKNKGMTLEKAEKIVKDPMYFGTMMVKLGDADGMVSGAVHSTGDLLRPGLQVIKTAKGAPIVSSFFIMVVPNCEYGDEGLLLFSDCGVNPHPNSEELAAIAISTAETAKNLCGMDPKIAMLSFSTKGSAEHDDVEKVRKATELVKAQRPDLAVDGELQVDAAIVPSVASKKAPGSDVAGKANVLIFPDLSAGNIAYKAVERFAKAEAIGPICQGFAKPINDLSRGCKPEDIVTTIAVTAVQAQAH